MDSRPGNSPANQQPQYNPLPVEVQVAVFHARATLGALDAVAKPVGVQERARRLVKIMVEADIELLKAHREGRIKVTA